MLERYEEQIMLRYIINALSSTVYVRDNFDSICKWIFSERQNYLKYQWRQNQEFSNEMDFMNFAYKNKHKAIAQIKDFAKSLQKLPLARNRYAPSILEKNLEYLQKIFKLKNYEKEFLGLAIRESCCPDFEDIFSDIKKHSRNTNTTDRGILLKINLDETYSIVRKNSLLVQLGLIDYEYDGNIEASSLSKHLYFQKFQNIDDLKEYLLGKPVKANLDWDDFKHIKQTKILKQILQMALIQKEKGINILLYGEPGTGKTEFSKTLAKEISAKLYSIGDCTNSYIEDEESNRYEQLLRAHIILEKDFNTLLMIDEADDILSGRECSFVSRKRDDLILSKIKVNRLLENNSQPTIWITNNICDMDKAYLRRFTYAINFTRPKKPVQEEIWRKNLKANSLPFDNQTTKKFADKYSISPSFISSAVKSAKLINGGLQEIEETLDVLQEAYNNGKKKALKKTMESTAFNLQLLNTDTDLTNLAEQILKLNKLNFSMCLYGISGTGKSAFAQYLGEKLKIPIIKKKCSDLLSKYVGETEQNIASAFSEAEEQGALLIFDEADSFLQDRSNALRSWEVTQVNEMLTQMESYPYPFVCTTNLMDSLDKASLRRFTFKVAYDYMTPEQSNLAFKHFFNFSNIDLSHLNSLAPGDFVVVKQKAEILGALDKKEELIKMLEQEQLNKHPIQRKIGFL